MAVARIHGRRFIFLGDGTNPPVEEGKIIIDITFSNIPSAPGSTFADFKYDKELALILQKDDGYSSDVSTVYRWLEKGEAFNGTVLGAPTFTDGCGNNLKWKYSFAVPTLNFGEDTHNGTNPAYTTWAEYAEMYSKGWTMINHSYGSGDGTGKDGDREYMIKMNEIKFFNELIQSGVYCRTRHLVIPDVQEGFTSSCISMGYKSVCSQFGINCDDGYRDKGELLSPPASDFARDYFLLYREYFGDLWTQHTLDYDIPLIIDRMFEAKGVRKAAMVAFSHGPGPEEEHYNIFRGLSDYVKNHSANNDCLWVPSMHEFWDYLETKKYATKTETLTGNKLRITINHGNIPILNQFRDMSLLVTGGNIASVEVQGADNYSFNNSTGLINVFKKKLIFPTPELDERPARILSASVVGNTLQLIFDKAIAQSIKEAWSVEDRIVTALTGSGTNWVLTLDAPAAIGKFLYYRMQNGNAVTTQNGLKLCSFINWQI